jgi:cytochrome P450
MSTGCPEWVRELNLWSDRVMHADPYPRYAELRAQCPIAWSDALGGHWLVTRHADIVRVLHDPETFSSVTKTLPVFVDPLGVQIPGEVDGIEHTRYRQAILPVMSPGALAELTSKARTVIRRLLGEVGPPGFEFVGAVAIPYVFEVTMALLGIAPEHHGLIRAWEDGGLRKAPHDPALTARAGEFLSGLIAERRANWTGGEPRDLLEHLATTQLGGERLLTLDEAVRMAVFLMKAGLHTTANSFGNCVAWLAQNPDLRDVMVQDPERTSEVLEELMRWESILVITRTATRDVTVGDREVREGQHLLLLTGSAGRDEEVFDHADVFDYERPARQHLMFGSGPHRCAGRHLARLELQVGIEELVAAFPDFRADPERSPKRYTAMSRGAKEIQLLVGPA